VPTSRLPHLARFLLRSKSRANRPAPPRFLAAVSVPTAPPRRASLQQFPCQPPRPAALPCSSFRANRPAPPRFLAAVSVPTARLPRASSACKALGSNPVTRYPLAEKLIATLKALAIFGLALDLLHSLVDPLLFPW
jgi:hypothetical protein